MDTCDKTQKKISVQRRVTTECMIDYPSIFS